MESDQLHIGVLENGLKVVHLEKAGPVGERKQFCYLVLAVSIYSISHDYDSCRRFIDGRSSNVMLYLHLPFFNIILLWMASRKTNDEYNRNDKEI